MLSSLSLLCTVLTLRGQDELVSLEGGWLEWLRGGRWSASGGRDKVLGSVTVEDDRDNRSTDLWDLVLTGCPAQSVPVHD